MVSNFFLRPEEALFGPPQGLTPYPVPVPMYGGEWSCIHSLSLGKLRLLEEWIQCKSLYIEVYAGRSYGQLFPKLIDIEKLRTEANSRLNYQQIINKNLDIASANPKRNVGLNLIIKALFRLKLMNNKSIYFKLIFFLGFQWS